MIENYVKIIPSKELVELRLEALEGRYGKIIEDLTGNNRRNKGYQVRLIGGEHLGESIWFIPLSSTVPHNPKK